MQVHICIAFDATRRPGEDMKIDARDIPLDLVPQFATSLVIAAGDFMRLVARGEAIISEGTIQ
ncbi:hypothetical protein HYW30_01970 [Candidatus Azambacteria bacterium]|nr:hypothetical protein [Candidatus Azambacteria bacterium]